jgi:TIR domain
MRKGDAFQVFISHASADTWVARQIAIHVKRCGAACFLDVADIDHGDDFDKKIRRAALASQEMVLLLTPWATTRPFVWLEVGAFWSSSKRIVVLLHGLSSKEVTTDERLPVVLKRIDLLPLNEVDRYFSQLRRRIAEWSASHA